MHFRRAYRVVAALSAAAGLTALAFACSATPRTPTAPSGPAVTSIALVPQQVTLGIGDSIGVQATPEDSSGAPLTGVAVGWASSASGVASVSADGMIHAAGAGSTVVTATAGHATANLPVNVSSVPVASVVLTPSDSLACVVGGTVQFFAKALDASGNLLFDRPVSWSASPTAVATVDSGIVHCAAPGTAIITATIESRQATGRVSVSPAPVASVTLSPSGTQSCLVGTGFQLSATLRDSGGNVLTGRTTTWSSSVPSVAAVSASGSVQCVAVGGTLITATAGAHQAADSVLVSLVPVASVTLSPAGQQTCSAGASIQLTATAKDASGHTLAGRPVTWSSAPSSVATVSTAGLVQCVATGQAVVTATIETKHAADTVTVIPAAVGSVTITPNPASVTAGATTQLTAVVKDKSGHVLSGRTIAWSISPTSTATIASTGVVTGVVAGSAVASASTGGVTGTATVSVTAAPPGLVQVPASMRTPPFDVPRTMNMPANFTIAVYTRIPGARFIAVTPDGNLLVSNPGAGTVYLVRPNSGGDPLVTTFVSGLNLPHGLVFHTIGGTTYLYVSETDGVDRYVYHTGDLTAQSGQKIIAGLPDGSSTGLNGSYAHALKNIALDGNDNLFVSIGSSCNVCTGDVSASPVRGAIYVYGPDGSGGRLYARGVRNAEGLAVLGMTNTLWTAVNNRDDIPYPGHDGLYPYGAVVQSYVDNHPPDELMGIADGGNYGWPYCNPTPDSVNGYDNMPFDPAVDAGVNDAGQVDCTTMNRINKGIQAHSAPLGLIFLQGTNVPAAYQNGALIALHGSWDRSVKTGYKVIWVPWGATLPMTGVAPADLVAGWTDGSTDWGRPVGVAVDAAGTIYITDDASGTVYKLTGH